MDQEFFPITPDKLILKKIIVKGVTNEDVETSPKPGDEVTIHYTGMLEDKSIFDSTREKESPFCFRLNKEQVIQGIDISVASMKKGETAEFIIDPHYAYGAEGVPPSIPPNTALIFSIELKDFKESYMIDKDQMTVSERLQGAITAKEKGNESFKKNNIIDALDRYTQAIYLIEPNDPENIALPEHFVTVLLSSYLNAANCCIVLKRWNDVVHYSNKVLFYNRNHCKALFRCGLGHLELRHLQKSKEYLFKAARLEPRNVDIRHKLQLWKAAMILDKCRHKRLFGGIFESGEKNVKGKASHDTSPSIVIGFVIKVPSDELLYFFLVHVDSNALMTSDLERFLTLCDDLYQSSTSEWLGYRDMPIRFIQKGAMIQAGYSEKQFSLKLNSPDNISSALLYQKGSFCMKADALHKEELDFFITCDSNCCVDPAYIVVGKISEGMDTLEHLQELPTTESFQPHNTPWIVMSQVV